MEAVGFLLLAAAVVFSAEGAGCPVSTPHCYRKSTETDEDISCELEDREASQGVRYILFIENRSSERVKFETTELIVDVPLEFVLTAAQSNIWVERQKNNTNCTSNKTTVILQNLVKYSAPTIQKKVRSAGNLMLSWPKAKDNKGAIHEIRWRKINATWQNDTFETEDKKEDDITDIWDSYCLQLQIHSVYQVQIRRKAKQCHIWSDWSNTVDVPVEIKAPIVRWREEKKKGKRTVTLRWDAPPPEASYSGVTYNLTLKLLCETKNKTTNKTSYSLTAADSEVRVSIIAINNVSTSPIQEIIIPPVQHLKHCHKGSLNMPEKYCLEWYKLKDGETRTSHVNTSTRASVESIKNGMEKFVRYYYFIHTGRNERRQTKSKCPVYSEEGAPVAEPHNVTVVNMTENSAVLTWVPIPVQDQRGFLLHYAIWISRDESHMAYYEVPEIQTRFLLSNLSKESSYTVHIAGRTKVGAGPNATAHFLLNPGPVHIPNNGFSKNILTVFGVSGVLLLFSICFSIALKMLRRKLLPVIPRPVIPATDPCRLDHQDLKEATEEVHNVTLLYLNDPDKPSRCLNLEQSTVLHNCQDTNDEEEEDEDIEAHFTNSFPNPNYKGQMLRLSELQEVADKTQKERNCDISTPSYRHGSVL